MKNPKELTLAEIADRLETMQSETAAAIRALGAKVEAQAIYAQATEPVAVPASVVAKMLTVNRAQVYQMHHEGILNGFRPLPNGHLKFLVSEVREVAARLSAGRANT